MLLIQRWQYYCLKGKVSVRPKRATLFDRKRVFWAFGYKKLADIDPYFILACTLLEQTIHTNLSVATKSPVLPLAEMTDVSVKSASPSPSLSASNRRHHRSKCGLTD